MSEEKVDKIDITKAAQDLANEKLEQEKKEKETSRISELESKLKEYEKKEEDLRLAEEEKKKTELHKRLEKLEKESIEKDTSHKEQIEKLSQRMSHGGTIDNPSTLTKEEYEANKSAYDTMALKDMLPTVFRD